MACFFNEMAYLSIWLEMRFNIIGICQVNKSSVDTVTNCYLGEVAVGSTVDIVNGDNVRSGLQTVNNGSSSSRARAESKTMFASFKKRDGIFKVVASGVSRSRIIKALR